MLDVPHQFISYSYEHQQVISLLLRKIGNYFESKQMGRWEILSAIKIDESVTSPVPDLSICCDTEPKVAIEIINNSSEEYNYSKLAKLVSEYDLTEGFYL